MKFGLLNTVLFFLFSHYSYSQNLSEIERKLDSLNTELSRVNLSIHNLNTRKDSIKSLIQKLNNEKGKIEAYQSRDILMKTIIEIGGHLKDEKENQIMPIKEKDSILVFKEFDYPNFKVIYKNRIGFVNYLSLRLNNDMNFIIRDSELVRAKEKIN